ncbi:MAG: hypothetical protein EOP81_06530 [Variovorax sp.]|nr:MAG: hypothetical protein EOP81_06530 [Variovorax sp.]
MPNLQTGMHQDCGPFTYSLREVASRDEIVFKSVLRVLQGKTRHAWQHIDGDADLVVRSRFHAETGPQNEFGHSSGHSHPGTHPDLSIGVAGSPASRVLAWPLRIADVIECLDQAGDEIMRMARRALPGGAEQAAHRPTPATPAVPAGVRITEDVTSEVFPANRRMVLTRWPGPGLLQRDLRYIKLAAMLTGQPVNLLEMASRSGFDMQLCRDFVHALRAESLIRVLDGTPATPAVQALEQPRPPMRRINPPQPGLIARIRQRLEMIVGSPTAK